MNWAIVVSVYKDETVLNSTLLKSPALKAASRVLCQRNYTRVIEAYNAALQECEEDIVVFVHPDVYLPASWPEALQRSLEWLSKEDPGWGVLGLVGLTKEGVTKGCIFSTGLNGF